MIQQITFLTDPGTATTGRYESPEAFGQCGTSKVFAFHDSLQAIVTSIKQDWLHILLCLNIMIITYAIYKMQNIQYNFIVRYIQHLRGPKALVLIYL